MQNIDYIPICSIGCEVITSLIPKTEKDDLMRSVYPVITGVSHIDNIYAWFPDSNSVDDLMSVKQTIMLRRMYYTDPSTNRLESFLQYPIGIRPPTPMIKLIPKDDTQ